MLANNAYWSAIYNFSIKMNDSPMTINSQGTIRKSPTYSERRPSEENFQLILNFKLAQNMETKYGKLAKTKAKIQRSTKQLQTLNLEIFENELPFSRNRLVHCSVQWVASIYLLSHFF